MSCRCRNNVENVFYFLSYKKGSKGSHNREMKKAQKSYGFTCNKGCSGKQV